MKPLLTRVALPTVRQYIPAFVESAVPTTYLGMPPIPIGGMQKSVTTSIRGISTGRVTVVSQPNRPTDITGRTKGRSVGAIRTASKRKGVQSTTSNHTNVKKKSSNKAKKKGISAGGKSTKRRGKLVVLSRGKNGRFTK